MRPIVKILSLLAVATAAAVPARAATAGVADASAAASLAAPPTPVGRVSLVTAGLSFHAAGESPWSPAGVNYPVATGEGFKTGPADRAELEIGADRIAMAGDTEIEIATLDARRIDMRLARGQIGFRLERLGGGDSVTITLPGGSARLTAPGRYGIAAGTAQEPARLAVFEGRAQLSGGSGELAVKFGAAAMLSGGKPVAAPLEPAAKDAFAASSPAPKRASAPPLPADVGANMTGIEELAAAGRWASAPGLGAVWYPKAVPANWVPYRDGHWAWIEPWGWTWIDDLPWGFAPSHFGRWAEIGGEWGWLPGRKAADPIFVPAVVAFLGTAGFGISYAGGRGPAIGWFPLAPGEIYWPSYSSDLRYIRRLNEPDVANAVTIRLGADGKPPVEVVNWHFANRLAASVVPRPSFAAGKPAALALLQLPQERLREAPAIMGSPRVTPAMVRALAPPAPREPVERVAVASERRILHPSIAERLRRAEEMLRLGTLSEHGPSVAAAHLRVPASARAEPKRLVVHARVVRVVPKPAHPPLRPVKITAKSRLLRLALKKKPAP